MHITKTKRRTKLDKDLLQLSAGVHIDLPQKVCDNLDGNLSVR
jgi:hypothetical protein